MHKILIVFGTRPDAIKMAPVIRKFQEFPACFKTLVCVTGQHRQMLDQVLSIFEIKPDFDLNIMQPDQDLYDIFSGIMLKIRDIYSEVNPDIVFVHGDTSTSTAAALAAFYQKIPVAHIESGLRTNNMYSPWPEEINRQITSRIATYHFAPTIWAKTNLIKENINENQIIVTGNTVIDSLRIILKRINESSELLNTITGDIVKNGYDPQRISGSRKLILITGHRRENFGEGLQNICLAIKMLSEKFPECDFLYPVHLNPKVRESVSEFLGGSAQSNLFLIDPLEYVPFIYLMQKCYLILTDSGGIQEEAPDLGKPVLVMRDTTERPEGLEAGVIELVGTNKEKIVEAVKRLILDTEYYKSMANIKNPFGDGNASKIIFNYFSDSFYKTKT